MLLDKIAVGGLGEVWKARDDRLNRIVALKFILAGRDNLSARELLREARAASALNHPNIVTILEIGEADGDPYIAMEFVDGVTLRARMARGVPLEESVRIVSQVCLALSAAHNHGIVHRDLKPENIMLRVDNFVKLVDFGLAKVLPWNQDTASEAETARTTAEPEDARIANHETVYRAERGSLARLGGRVLMGPASGLPVLTDMMTGQQFSRESRAVLYVCFSLALVIALAGVLTPYREVTQPPARWHWLLEMFVPGTARGWGPWGGLALGGWLYGAFEIASQHRYWTGFQFASGRAFGFPPSIVGALDGKWPADPGSFWTYAPAVLLILAFTLNLVVVLRSRRLKIDRL